MDLKKILKMFAPERRALSQQTEYNLLTAGLVPGTSHRHYVGITAPSQALRNSAVYSCIKILAETLSTLPVRLIERSTKAEVAAHPISALFDAPNEEQTFTEFLEMVLVNFFVWGNAYVEKEISRGQVVSLYPMCSPKTVVLRKDDRLYYEYVTPTRAVVIPGENVMHLRLFGMDDLTGTAPIWAADRAICLSLTQEQMSIDSYADGVRPDYIIHLPPEKVLERIQTIDAESLKQDKLSLQQQIEQSKTRRGLYVPFGYDVSPYAANFQQAQLQESRDFQVLEIARIWRVPPSKLGVMSKVSTGQGEAERISFYQDTLRPILVKLEKRLERALLSESDRQRFQIRFNVRGLLRGDTAAQTEQYTKLWQIGAILTNEIRDWEDLPPLDHPRATEPNFPVNQTTEQIGGATQLTNPADGGVPSRVLKRTVELTDVQRRSLDKRQTASKFVEPLFRDAVGRIVRKERATVMPDAKSILANRSAANLEDRLRQLYSGELERFIRDNITQPVEALFNAVKAAMETELGTTFDAGELRRIVQQYVDIYTRDYVDSSLGQLITIIRATDNTAEIVPNLDTRFTEWENGTSEETPSRAQKEATQESRKGSNVFAKALYILGGISTLRWITQSPCEICEPFSGITFSVKASLSMPPIHRSCSCMVTSA